MAKAWLLLTIYSVSVTVACAAVQPPCPPGFHAQGERCVNPHDAVEKYAGCIVRDATVRTGKTISTKIDTAKSGATSASDVKEKLERSVESTRDRCVLLDISSRCFALASGEKDVPPLPAECVAFQTDD